MDYKLNGLLRHYVLGLLFLEVQWRPTCSASIHTSCDLDGTKSLTDLLISDTKHLLETYIKDHTLMKVPVPDECPNSTISGTNISEQLQDIYIKNGLFNVHILKVKDYQKDTWDGPESAANHTWPLLQVQGNLINHLAKIKNILVNIDSLPTTPAPPHLSHNDDYAKKVYGWGVIVTLENWLKNVSLVLVEAKKVCD